jgi:threonine dehydrogenase-like Zn-dependent dehydrogenase
MKIAVIGTGYVGLVSAACFAELGHKVIAVDNDSAKVEMLCAGQIPIHEEHLPELMARHFGSRLHFSSDTRHACEQSDVIFICVGTPPSYTGEADLSFVEGVARELAFGVGISPEPLYLPQARPTGSAPNIAAQTDQGERHMDRIFVTGGAGHTQHAEQM